ncbi:PfkB family carbohydrate kinase [Massilia sp. R2A-15]|uniref:PfkB family carbohydrate kinase n=1 Tax=Massilia sp. R2A-15 TaxID=3064278 RepID=UPI002733B227|nr:PfkB family carbohydrate kinase [Massilia sp. R2A-15]WLI91439.1 PfkB family carbohydrate kinase [Massilia sp. R2A-15]
MIATFGEALVDLIEQPDGRFAPCLGGSVCNFTVALARQGVPTRYLNPLSRDHFGERFDALLRGAGVDLPGHPRSAGPTSLAVVSLDAYGSPSYAFHREGVADRDIDARAAIAAFPAPLELLHTGGLTLVPADLDKTLEICAAAAARGALVSVDANMRPMLASDLGAYGAGVRRALDQAHVAKVSDEDLDALGIGRGSLDAIVGALFPGSALELVVYTQGPRGAALLTRRHQVELAAPAGLRVVDTVGAGDCFHAGLVACLLRAGALASREQLAALEPAQLRAALRHAIAAASVNIMRSGCDPATWQETLDEVSRHASAGQ